MLNKYDYNFIKNNDSTIFIQLFCYNYASAYLARSNKLMSENEMKLINMIRNHSTPGEALMKAIEIIVLFLNSNNTENHH